MLSVVFSAGLATEAFADFVAGHGELWSAQLVAASCRQQGCNAAFLDARDVLVVSPTPDGTSVDVDYVQSNKNLDDWFAKNGQNPSLVIATGFIAKNPSGQATTLRRNGSDYSATIFGSLFQCSHITIWTDVDGVYSADPRKVSEAFCLGGLTYNEAWELSYFGANVLHPRTTLPAMKYGIPITIRNFFNLDAEGTKIGFSIPENESSSVKAFSTIDNISLISVEVGTYTLWLLFGSGPIANCSIFVLCNSEMPLYPLLNGHALGNQAGLVRVLEEFSSGWNENWDSMVNVFHNYHH